MERAGVPQARETAERLLPVLTKFSPYWHEDPSLSEGLAGLTVGLAELPFSSPEREACLRLCAGKLLVADVPEIPDLFKGAAGLAVALTAAHKALGDSRCAEKVSAILAQLRRDYRDDLHGWPDSAAKLRWMAVGAVRRRASPWRRITSRSAFRSRPRLRPSGTPPFPASWRKKSLAASIPCMRATP